MRSLDVFRTMTGVEPAFAVSTTAINIATQLGGGTGQDITINVLGDGESIWIYPNGTATTANGFKFTGAGNINIRLTKELSIISDTTGATVQIATWLSA